MTQHTQGQLHTGGDGTIIYDKDGWGVASATVFHGRQEPDTSKENARRLVACWNACEGFETEALERHGIDGVMFGTKEWLIRLNEQRDALLAALENAADSLERAEFFERAAEARAHIAAARGGAV